MLNDWVRDEVQDSPWEHTRLQKSSGIFLCLRTSYTPIDCVVETLTVGCVPMAGGGGREGVGVRDSAVFLC